MAAACSERVPAVRRGPADAHHRCGDQRPRRHAEAAVGHPLPPAVLQRLGELEVLQGRPIEARKGSVQQAVHTKLFFYIQHTVLVSTVHTVYCSMFSSRNYLLQF